MPEFPLGPLTTDELIDYIGQHKRGTIDDEVIAALRRLKRFEIAVRLAGYVRAHEQPPANG